MIRFLVPLDGSAISGRAVEQLLTKSSWYREPLEIHLLNVQSALSGDVAGFVQPEQIRQFHLEAGLKVLAPARAKLEAAKVPHVFHIGVGEPAQVIAQYAKDKHCDQIFMSSRGLGSIAGIVLGSVTTKVIHLSEVPVLLVK